jgi:hypothetical protein
MACYSHLSVPVVRPASQRTAKLKGQRQSLVICPRDSLFISSGEPGELNVRAFSHGDALSLSVGGKQPESEGTLLLRTVTSGEPISLPLLEAVFTRMTDETCTPIGLISLSASHQLQSTVSVHVRSLLFCKASPWKTFQASPVLRDCTPRLNLGNLNVSNIRFLTQPSPVPQS